MANSEILVSSNSLTALVLTTTMAAMVAFHPTLLSTSRTMVDLPLNHCTHTKLLTRLVESNLLRDRLVLSVAQSTSLRTMRMNFKMLFSTTDQFLLPLKWSMTLWIIALESTPQKTASRLLKTSTMLSWLLDMALKTDRNTGSSRTPGPLNGEIKATSRFLEEPTCAELLSAMPTPKMLLILLPQSSFNEFPDPLSLLLILLKH